ncbi:MAG TPA: carboxypeptidase-like regulatory domain-containing protein [Bryobacteraceae bacterium]|nr:carboxypeptidase-like regulatory domain-containing protein [Bryobacteraceae bacterium]
MPKRAWILGLAALLSLASGAPGQTRGAFTLAGVVVRAGTNQPLNHVLVTIAYPQRREWRLSYITDTDGRFVFQNLPAGKWDMIAEKNGYRLQIYQGDEGYSTAVAVGPGLDTTHIVFPLSPPGILSGTVTDDQGDPVRQALVLLFRNGVALGKLTTQNAGQQQTDAAGEFSFGSLRPGTYYVAVSARPWYAKNFSGTFGISRRFASTRQLSSEEVQQLQEAARREAEAARQEAEAVPHDERDVAYPVTYYGDGTDGASAEPVSVQEGEEARIRITVRATPAWRLRIPDGVGHGVQIEVPGPGGVPINFPAQVTSDAKQIEVLGVPSGRYNLRLISKAGASKIVDVTGDQSIDFSDVTPVVLTAHVTWEGSTARASNQVFMRLIGENNMNTAGGHITSDGSFNLDENNNLVPGRYRILLQNSNGFVIRSVQAKGARYANGVLDIAGDGPVDLSITATSNLAKIDGIAMRNNAPCPAAMILLLPADGNADAIRRDQSDSDGTFTLPEVLPGRYTLVGIDNGRDLAYQDPAVMAKYLPQGQSVEVPLKSQSPLTIAVQPRLP